MKPLAARPSRRGCGTGRRPAPASGPLDAAPVGLNAERTGHAPSGVSPEQSSRPRSRAWSVRANQEQNLCWRLCAHARGARCPQCVVWCSAELQPVPALGPDANLGTGRGHACSRRGQTGDGPRAPTCPSAMSLSPGPIWDHSAPGLPGPRRPCLTSGCPGSALSCS